MLPWKMIRGMGRVKPISCIRTKNKNKNQTNAVKATKKYMYQLKRKIMAKSLKVSPEWQIWFLNILPQNQIWWTAIYFYPCNLVLFLKILALYALENFFTNLIVYPVNTEAFGNTTWKLGKRTFNKQPRHLPLILFMWPHVIVMCLPWEHPWRHWYKEFWEM